jgi:hypothetical protein
MNTSPIRNMIGWLRSTSGYVTSCQSAELPGLIASTLTTGKPSQFSSTSCST